MKKLKIVPFLALAVILHLFFTAISLANNTCASSYFIVISDENDEEQEVADAVVFMVVEIMPQFPGGQTALNKFFAENIKYPVEAQKNGIEGRVYVNFVVNTDGTLTQVTIIRGSHPLLDKEALRVVKAMPKWIPGEQRGKKVKVSYTLPISFSLNQ